MKKFLGGLVLFVLIAFLTGCNYSKDIFENATESAIANEAETTGSNSYTSSFQQPCIDVSTLEFYPNPTDEGSANVIFSYAHDDMGQLYIFIKDWNKYYLMPIQQKSFSWQNVSVGIYEDKAILFAVDGSSNSTNTLKSILFSKNSNEYVERLIDIGENLYVTNLFCNFISSKEGFLFVFEDESLCQHFTVFKTDSGGNTWNPIECDNTPTANWREHPTVAKFITDEIGMVAYRYRDRDDLCDRTYLTFDGGNNWKPISTLPFEFNSNNYSTEVSGFEYIDEKYLLHVKVYDGHGGFYVHFKSIDLINWTLEE